MKRPISLYEPLHGFGDGEGVGTILDDDTPLSYFTFILDAFGRFE